MPKRLPIPPAKRAEIIRATSGLLQQGRFVMARQGAEMLLAADPGDADGHFLSGLGHLLRDELDPALKSLSEAVRLSPRRALFRSNLGAALLRKGDPEGARAALEKAVALEPNNVDAWANLAGTYALCALPDKVASAAMRAAMLAPERAELVSQAFSAAMYASDADHAKLTALARSYGKMLTRGIPVRTSHTNSRDPDRQLKVGIVSPDLRNHPAGRYLAAAIEHLDPARIELVAYSNHGDAPDDPVTKHLMAAMPRWTNILAMSDDEAADRIVADGIDILIDLSGHAGGNRLPLFARKPAPIAITWLGFVATTGLDSIDYILGNRWVTPESEANRYSETIWRLDGTFAVYQIPPADLPIAPPPSLTHGFVTFGSINSFRKLTTETIETWTRVLKTVPDSRLILRSSSETSEATNAELASRFTSAGIAAERLRVESTLPDVLTSMARYSEIDIALDPFPYNGNTTTAEALYMGVPVLTVIGDSFAGHQGENNLRVAGLDEWIANDRDDYVARAASFASDLEALARLRQTLRARVVASPVYDTARFGREFDAALRGMWQIWCAT